MKTNRAFPIQKSEQEWKEALQAKGAEAVAFEVTRRAATERPFTGKYETHWENGAYHFVVATNFSNPRLNSTQAAAGRALTKPSRPTPSTPKPTALGAWFAPRWSATNAALT
jgi:SelR domain